MRQLIYILSFCSLGFSIGASAANMSAKTDCDGSLQKRMLNDPKVEGTCTATISVDGMSVTKKYHASIKMENGTAAGLAIREVCETCKTTGPVETQALDYSKLANWALAKAGQSLANGENVSAREESAVNEEDEAGEVSIDSCSAKATTSDRLSCRLGKLVAETDSNKTRELYLTMIQPELQKLAASKKDADQELLRRVMLTMATTAGNVTDSDPVINFSVREYAKFIEMRQALAQYPNDRQEIRTKYEKIFADRPMWNKKYGVDLEPLNANSRLLLKLTREESGSGGDKAVASANGPTTASNPRSQFGNAGPQGRGFTPSIPSRGSAGASGGLDRIFHAN